MAAGLGFKDFVTGEVLTANDVDGYLMQGIWVFASAAARSAAVTSPQEGNYSYLKDTNSTEYYTGTAWVAAGGGGGGKVLQVVQATTSTATQSTSTSYADTLVTANITPSLNTSKVLALVTMSNNFKHSDVNVGLALRLRRGSTTVFDFATQNGRNGVAQGAHFNTSASYLDSPATTSSTTYTVQLASNSGVLVGTTDSGTSSIILMEIGA